MERNRKLIAALALPLVLIGGFALYLVTMASRLPDELAVNWGPNGQADGFASIFTFGAMMIGISLALTLLMGLIATASSGAIGGRGLLVLPAAIVAFIIALSVGTTIPQLDGGSAETLPGWIFPIAVVAAMLCGMLAWFIAGQPPQPKSSTDPAPADAERIDLPAEHTAIWSGTTPQAPVFLAMAAIAAIVGVVVAVSASWWLLVLFVPIAALLAGSASYRVTIGRSGVEATGTLFGWPRVRVSLDQIARADSGTIRALDYGGWGIRIGGRGGKATSAVVTRSGPALVITRTDDAELRISLDQPHEAASVLSTLLDRRADSQTSR